MPEKKKTTAAAPAAEAKESKTRKSAKACTPRPSSACTGLYVEFSGKQYNVTDIIDRAKADYRATHKVGVQSCKVYVKPGGRRCLLRDQQSLRQAGAVTFPVFFFSCCKALRTCFAAGCPFPHKAPF